MPVDRIQLIEQTRAGFRGRFGYQEAITVQAPGRVNLLGEHTDYNAGFVLPCAIDFYTIVSASPRADDEVNVLAMNYDGETDKFSVNSEIDQHPKFAWANYVRGVLHSMQQNGLVFSGADLAILGNIPQGAGLSSSASLEVAVGQAFNALYDLTLSQQDLALIAQQAENEFVGCQCGIMDQLIIAKGQTGHALLIDCRSLETKRSRYSCWLEDYDC